MSSATSNQRQPALASGSDGSRIITLDSGHDVRPISPGSEVVGLVGALRLRGSVPRSNLKPRVSWREDVIDNEGSGRKSSKICCIYHRPKAFDESSDEDGSSDDDDSDSECSRRSGTRLGRVRSHPHPKSSEGTSQKLDDSDSDKNAYETMPGSRKGNYRV